MAVRLGFFIILGIVSLRLQDIAQMISTSCGFLPRC